MTDNLGQHYRVRPVRGGGTIPSGQPGQPPPRWTANSGKLPELRVPGPLPLTGPLTSSLLARVRPPRVMQARIIRRPDRSLPTPASATAAVSESFIALLPRQVTETDRPGSVPTVWDQDPRTGKRTSAGGTAAERGPAEWRQSLVHLWGRQAWRRALDGDPARAGLAAGLSCSRKEVILRDITVSDIVSVQLYGHPWVTGEYWPMITPCFQVRAVDDTGSEHQGIRGSGGGSPEGSWNFWFWPPVAPAARRIRVIVSTLWEAACASRFPGRRNVAT